MITFKSWTLALALSPLAMAIQPAAASLFVSTGHTGAQVQVDVNHTQFWTYSVSSPVTGIDGGLFDMKRGSNTSEDITFVIFQGVFDDWGTATPLLSVTLQPADFDTMFNPVFFQGTPIDLAANTNYTAVLSSSALDPQSKAYFIKSGDLSFVDGSGNPVDPGSPIIPGELPTTPEPGSLSVMAIGVAVLIRRRR